jgi:4-hydroxybutyryl-CoA dehydratase/vinylacetyl-CoA-Delta-isomerase
LILAKLEQEVGGAMGLRNVAQFLEGLQDDREIYYRGERVESVTDHPELGLAAQHASIDFELSEDPRFRESAIYVELDGEEHSAFYRIPRTPEDLLLRSRLIETATTRGGTLVTLIKEIGSDALFSLMSILQGTAYTDGFKRVEDFYQWCRDGDLTLAVAQTDVKGDRSKRPADQSDPDMYLRVVSQNTEGIVVRGAKAHTSCAPYVDQIIVLPSRNMSTADRPWSVGFAVPVASPGLRLYAADFLHGAPDHFTQPVSARHRMIEALTVFDDVFVPWERVFFHDRPDLAGAAALAFVEFHRFTAISYKLPLLDALVGCAITVAEANGISNAGHVRDKLTWLESYAETVRGLTELAALRCRLLQGIAVPDVFTTNLAKWTFAKGFHQALETVQDLAGGLLVTGPSGPDWTSVATRPVLEKYLVAAWPAERRLAILNLIRDLTTGMYGGYQAVLAIHAEGSLEAEKLTLHRAYQPNRAVGLALQLAGLEEAE